MTRGTVSCKGLCATNCGDAGAPTSRQRPFVLKLAPLLRREHGDKLTWLVNAGVQLGLSVAMGGCVLRHLCGQHA